MKYAHLLHAFYGQPWHLLADHWQHYHLLLQRAIAGQEISSVVARRPHLLQALPQRRPVPVVGPIDSETGDPFVEQMVCLGPLAIIPVHGPLGRRLNMLDLMCGGCDYLNISAFCEIAEEDPQTQAALFDFDSPGGAADGVSDCAADIAALNSSKQTVAFTGAQCCSAAYGLASQCEEFWATPTAQVGSLGTIICGEDDSAAWAQQGRKLELFTTSPLKAVGMEGKPWTDQDRAYLQERLLQSDAIFKDLIRAGRPGMDADAYNGAWYFADKSPNAPGQSALSLKMVDALAGSLEEAAEALTQ